MYVHRNQSKANDHNEEHFPKRHIVNVGPQNRILKIETQGAHNHSHNNHWLQSNESDFEKIAYGHFAPAVIISITNHKARKQKEKINRQIPVIDDLVKPTRGVCFHNMKSDHHNSSHSSQTI